MSSSQRPWEGVPRDTTPKSSVSRKLNRIVSEDARVTDVVLKRFREDVFLYKKFVLMFKKELIENN